MAGGASGQHGYPTPKTLSRPWEAWLRDSIREAVGALQGNAIPGADSAAVLDSALVVEVSRAVQEIHRRVPALANARNADDGDLLLVTLAPDSGRAVSHRAARAGSPDDLFPRWRLPMKRGRRVTGIRGLDSLDPRLGGDPIQFQAIDTSDVDPFYTVVIAYARYMNVPRLIALYDRVPGVKWPHAQDNMPTFVTTSIRARDASNRTWLFQFDEGRGDCPAGCIWFLRTVVRYDRLSRALAVVSVDTLPHPHPPPGGR